MKRFRKLLISILPIFCLLSCEQVEEQVIVDTPEHVLTIDDWTVTAYSSVKVNMTFNLDYDPTLKEVGIQLEKNDHSLKQKQTFDLSSLHSKESAYFEGLTSGTFLVRSYLIHNLNDTVYSNEKSILVSVTDFSDFLISCYPTYVASTGKSIFSKNSDEWFGFFIHSDEILNVENILLKIGGHVVDDIQVSTSFSSDYDKKYSYMVSMYVPEELTSGQYDIEIFDNTSWNTTGLVLDKLSGSWERMESLYTGPRMIGTKFYFQSDKYGYIGMGDPGFISQEEVYFWRFNMEDYTWKQLKTLNVQPNTLMDKYGGAIVDNNAYTVMNVSNLNDTMQFAQYHIWKYDLSQNTWSNFTKMPYKEMMAQNSLVFFLNNKIYMAGGLTNGSSPTRKVVCYDIRNNSWSVKNHDVPFDFIGTSEYFTTFSTNTAAYLLTTDYMNLNCWKYTEATDSWTSFAMPFPFFTLGGMATLHDGKIFYVGGVELGSGFEYSLNYCYTYDEVSQSWIQIAHLPERATNGVAFNYNNTLMVGLGRGEYASTVSMYRYRD